MGWFFRGAVVVMTLIHCTSASAEPNWQLVWSDEFDRNGAPDPAKWEHEEGFCRNNEAQYYTRNRSENARVEDGMLIIEARKERFPNLLYDPKALGDSLTTPYAEYTSASLITRGKADWTYGRIEVRAKLPQGKGVWPAIWMMGSNTTRVGWPACGEIDIMEFVGHTPDTVHGTVHFQKDGKHASAGDKIKIQKLNDDLHIFAVEWLPERLDFYVDQQKYHTFLIADADNKGENPFRKAQYLLINLAIGGSWGGKIDDSIFPQRLLIDYVRVYQKQEKAAGK